MVCPEISYDICRNKSILVFAVINDKWYLECFVLPKRFGMFHLVRFRDIETRVVCIFGLDKLCWIGASPTNVSKMIRCYFHTSQNKIKINMTS